MHDHRPVDHTLWFLTGVDNDQWDTATLAQIYNQGSRIHTNLIEQPRRIERIQARSGHSRRRLRSEPVEPATRGVSTC